MRRIWCDLSDEDFADLLLREGTKISENQDLSFLNFPPTKSSGVKRRTKRAYWGFDKLYSDAVETKNDFSRLGQMVGGFIKDNIQVHLYLYIYLSTTYIFV